MPSRRANSQYWVTEQDISDWPAADVVSLEGAAATDYERKVSAIKQYVSGATLKSIESSTGVSRQYLYYLIKRCQLPDADGRAIGFLALIKGNHLLSRRRSAPFKLTAGKSLPGALQGLFNRYPKLERLMFDLIVHKRAPESRRANQRLNWAQIQDIFEEECTKLGIHPPNYPFSSTSNGAVAIRRWGNRLRREYKRKKNILCDSRSFDLLPSRCYERVECDGHYVDLNWIVETPGLRGEGIVRTKVSRLWLIVLLETKSSAVIGYSISLNKANYSAADISRAIRSSLVPWSPRSLSISTIAYKPGECLPNALDPRLSYVCFDELWLDNAKSHLSNLFLSVLERTVNAVPVFGPGKSPNVRPSIEMIFDLIEEAGIHPLDGTTGSNTKDPRKTKKREAKYILKIEIIYDLIDILIVRYNTGIAPGTTITRLDVLKRIVERETTLLRQLPQLQREDCFKYDLFEVAKVGIERGQPILRWRDARYKGQGLLSVSNIVGMEVLVMADSNDLRWIKVSLIRNGVSLGILEVERRWRSTPHTLWTRGRVRLAMSQNSYLKHAADIPRAARAHAENVAKKNAKENRALAQMIAEEQMNNTQFYPKKNESVKEKTAEDSDCGDDDLDDELTEIISRLGSIYH